MCIFRISVCCMKCMHYSKHMLCEQDCVKFRGRIACQSFLKTTLQIPWCSASKKIMKILSSHWWRFELATSIVCTLKGVLHLWALFLKTLCIFSKNKATSDKVSYGSGQKCSKELENYSFTSVETIVVKLQWKMCENQYFPCFEP